MGVNASEPTSSLSMMIAIIQIPPRSRDDDSLGITQGLPTSLYLARYTLGLIEILSN